MIETRHNSIGHETPGHETPGHETKDANIRGIVFAGIGLAVTAALVALLVYGIFRYLADHPAATARDNPLAETGRQQFPPFPRLEEHPTVELKDLNALEDQILSTYGWMDRKSGVVRVPIDRAMDLQLERGFPVRKEAAKK